MGVEYEVTRIKKQLEKALNREIVDNEFILDLLTNLKDLKMTLEILQKTRVGYHVNNVRKKADKEVVINLAKSLIKDWKRLLPDSKKNEAKDKTDSRQMDKDSQDLIQQSEINPSLMVEEKDNTTVHQSHNNDKDMQVLSSGNPTRDLSRKLLIGALSRDGLNKAIFKELKGPNMKYKNRVRSRISNLKDSKNPNLCQKVLSGIITPEQIAKMTAEEMASDEMKKLRQGYAKEGIRDAQMAVTQGTKTDLLTCGKCHKKNCSYNQMQTRSADEPMTTFVFCHECGHRWKLLVSSYMSLFGIVT
ncbi:uncharacterized protein TRIADDRAFT_58083 [Trichoplax adhaerens]|uniref:Transcription elongation factor n=1 Tax=Trichoplax adhaerens TaxID=10228 RepID=B3S2M8_TRIAD|nr:hypothetical protein TRIADDRAFT_58083 [Trichoplax adhaerens]EDV23124.1 hypothetical protein TRIADDRAFT_58083 [Trichoplax adhaerens]|eukprot:XP_002114034.1 hypothetical protein TRIADDRAFT_58083 [Trichoplax adhaerens]